jgi:hypothetical protein
MSLFKKLFGEKKQPDTAMRGASSAPIQSPEQQDAIRTKMESELSASRDKRAADAASKEPPSNT